MTDTTNGDAKQEFELHVAYLTETQKSFVENTSKVAGFLLLALGWFATSKDARAYIGSAHQIAYFSAMAVAAAYLLSAGASWVVYRASAKTYQKLVGLAYLHETAYEARKLGLSTFVICVVGTGVLSGLLVFALLTAPLYKQ